MNVLMKEMPDRAFDVGHRLKGIAAPFSGGMAQDGLIPFCTQAFIALPPLPNEPTTTLIHDIAIERLNMVLCLDRAGLVGEDGPTHHGAFDLAALRPIPNLILSSPTQRKRTAPAHVHGTAPQPKARSSSLPTRDGRADRLAM